MPVDFDQLDAEMDGIINESAEAADLKLASMISSITRMTDDEVLELFPNSGDVKRLKDLMVIVKSAGDRSDKVRRIVSNAEGFGDVILTLLSKFA
jgi:hypothetical protein|tara:strand:- start:2397 stop:2681 length:285 start_codon:yes stop_codon:yes gene_type:complete